ncbi:MAG: hypothetical protein AB1726_00040 [Planctomycetota bacterium]
MRGPSADLEVGILLYHAVLACARAGGARVAATLIPDWSPWFDRFQQGGFAVWPSGLLLVARNYARKYDMLWLRDRWWYQLGDTDLV